MHTKSHQVTPSHSKSFIMHTKALQVTPSHLFTNKLLDTFAIDHLLSKLNSQTVKVLSCLSPVNNVNLPYFANYIDSSSIIDKEFLCIPLCDGVHFRGYVVNMREQKIIHIDSLGFKSARNPTSNLIAKILFEDGICETFASFESFFQTRRQFDSNSCGVWLFNY